MIVLSEWCLLDVLFSPLAIEECACQEVRFLTDFLKQWPEQYKLGVSLRDLSSKIKKRACIVMLINISLC